MFDADMYSGRMTEIGRETPWNESVQSTQCRILNEVSVEATMSSSRPLKFLLQAVRHADVEPRSMLWLGVDNNCSVHESNAFAHTDEAQPSTAGRSFGVKPSPAI